MKTDGLNEMAAEEANWSYSQCRLIGTPLWRGHHQADCIRYNDPVSCLTQLYLGYFKFKGAITDPSVTILRIRILTIPRN